MTIWRRNAPTVRNRLGRRVRQRYLRWLARQPATGVCSSERWRNGARSYRRRTNASFRNRLVLFPVIGLAVCVLLVMLGLAVVMVAGGLYFLPALFFEPPKHHFFPDLAQRDAVALTRLTIFQSIVLPLFGLWAMRCFGNSAELERRTFYEKYPRSRLVEYRLVFLGFLIWSAVVTLGATIGHGAAGSAVVAVLSVTGCLGWFAWTAAKRLMACPLGMPSSSVLGIALILAWLLACIIPGLCLSSAVLTISQYLKWLGPLGWLNDLLLGLSFGQVRNLWPLGIVCVLALALGHRLNRLALGWAFRRRLLTHYRGVPRASCPCRPAELVSFPPVSGEPRLGALGHGRNARGTPPVTRRPTGQQHLARDLRQALSGGDWKPVYYPRWLRGHGAGVLLLYGLVLLVQLILVGLVLFLESVESQAGIALDEKRLLCAYLSCVGGVSVVLLEVFAALFRGQSGLLEFARRPVSPGQVWRQVQGQGVRFAPTQVFLALPCIALTALATPGYWEKSCWAVAVALGACVAIRTTLCAGSCLIAVIQNWRQWLTALLMALVVYGGAFLIIGTAVSSFAVCVHPDWTPGERTLALLVPHIVTLTALALAWGSWHAMGRRGERRLPS